MFVNFLWTIRDLPRNYTRLAREYGVKTPNLLAYNIVGCNKSKHLHRKAFPHTKIWCGGILEGVWINNYGGPWEIRTPDLLHAMETRYQLR